jgi:hypothetical protein
MSAEEKLMKAIVDMTTIREPSQVPARPTRGHDYLVALRMIPVGKAARVNVKSETLWTWARRQVKNKAISEGEFLVNRRKNKDTGVIETWVTHLAVEKQLRK